jgi:hypothetical protein
LRAKRKIAAGEEEEGLEDPWGGLGPHERITDTEVTGL